MTIAAAQVPTANASKYLQQLCKHWSHRLAVDLKENTGTVVFPDAVATMTASSAELIIVLEAETDETLDRIKSVVANHLDRFAFREAPLEFKWGRG
jgi:hypothetical protein